MSQLLDSFIGADTDPTIQLLLRQLDDWREEKVPCNSTRMRPAELAHDEQYSLQGICFLYRQDGQLMWASTMPDDDELLLRCRLGVMNMCSTHQPETNTEAGLDDPQTYILKHATGDAEQLLLVAFCHGEALPARDAIRGQLFYQANLPAATAELAFTKFCLSTVKLNWFPNH